MTIVANSYLHIIKGTLKRFLFTKKKAKFDKVLFARKNSFKLYIDKLLKEIAEIIKIAEDFTKPMKFVKKNEKVSN